MRPAPSSVHSIARRALGVLAATLTAVLVAAGCASGEAPARVAAPTSEQAPAPGATPTANAPETQQPAAVEPPPAQLSACEDPAAQDLGDGHYQRDGRVYELVDGECMFRPERPEDAPADAGEADTASVQPTVAAEEICTDGVCPEVPADSGAQPIPEEMLAEGTVPEGENFVVIEVLQSENEPTGDEQIEDAATPTTSAPVDDSPPTSVPAEQPEAPDDPTPETPSSTTAPQTPTTTAPAAEPEPEDDEGDDTPSSVAATIHRPDYCELFDGTWNPSTSECESWTRVMQPLPEPVGDPVTLATEEDDHFVSGSGRRVVRTEPAAIQVGSCLHNNANNECTGIVIDIEVLGSGWWQITECTIHESFVLPEIGNRGWEFVAYAWQEDDGRFRVEQGNWRPGDDGPC